MPPSSLGKQNSTHLLLKAHLYCCVNKTFHLSAKLILQPNQPSSWLRTTKSTKLLFK